MPQMGESVTEGTVLEWHKQEGEFVEEGETVVEVSTDKVDAEVPAPASGVITKILKGRGRDDRGRRGARRARPERRAVRRRRSATSRSGGRSGRRWIRPRASDEVAVQAAEPAAPPAPEPAGNVPAEAGGGRGFRRSVGRS